MDAKDAAALLRMDRKRRKETANEDWQSPSDGEAEITKLKDGRTALAYRVPHHCAKTRNRRTNRDATPRPGKRLRRF
jgi:hypothetical protein